VSCPSVGCNVVGDNDVGDVEVVGNVAGVDEDVGCVLTGGRDDELDGCSDLGRFGGSEVSWLLSSGRDCRVGGVFGVAEIGLRIDRGSDFGRDVGIRGCRRSSRDLSRGDRGESILWSSMVMFCGCSCCIEEMSSMVMSSCDIACGCCVGCKGAVGGCGGCC
jgi:hypothetical protein